MLENSSKLSRQRAASFALGLPLWVTLGFFVAAQAITELAKAVIGLVGLDALGGATIAQTGISIVVYALALLIVIGVPWAVWHRRTTKAELGIARLPGGLDFALAPAGFVIYIIVTTLVGFIVPLLVPGFNGNQAQEVGFSGLTLPYQYVLAFLTLVVIAPLAEELLFRGYLYGKLRQAVPTWLAILIVSLLFGAVHMQWNVGIDVFVMSIAACLLREATGGIWSGVGLHMLKNGLAFYLLFINPVFFHTIGG